MSNLSSEFAGKDRKNSRPTQTAPMQDIKVEDRCKSAGFARASGHQRSKFVGVVTIFDLARCVQREGENPGDYLVEFLRENRDIFTWQPADMKGVARELAEHSLNIDPKANPVKLPLR